MKYGPQIIVTIVLLVLTGCASVPGAPAPEIETVDAWVEGVDFDGADLEFEVAVYNPYLIAIRAPRFRYTLMIDGVEFLRSRTMARVELPPGSTGKLRLPVRVSYYDLMRGYPELRDAAEVHYRLHAAVDVSVIGSSIELPFSHEGAIPIFRPPITTASKVRLADVSLEKARLIVEAEIENPNVFELGIGELRYEVDLGDVRVAIHSSTADGTMVGPRQTGKVTLTGDITSSEGLVKLLMNGISGVPRLSASGLVRTPYGMDIIGRAAGAP